MAKRDAKSRSAKTLVPDFHLWRAVAETVDPLKRHRRRAPREDMALPLPDETANNAASARVTEKTGETPFLPPYQAPPQRRRRNDPGIDPRVQRKLSRGRLEIGARIDLHGMRQDEARAALHRFLPARAAQGDRTVLVITGKGVERTDRHGTAIAERGVLKFMLPLWLSEPTLAPLVSGWSQAARGHGGEGAFYVRLKVRK